jgi:hypothetical protein
MQTTYDESVWTTRKYVTFVNRNQELFDEMMEEEINPMDYKYDKEWERKYPMHEQSTARK